MRVGALLLAAIFLLAACATPKPCTSRTEIIRVPQPVFISLPDEYVMPLAVPELSPAQGTVSDHPDLLILHNRQLEADIEALETVIDRAQDDRAQIRRLQEQRRERSQ